jgi:signal transduction histidine kinase
VTLNTCEPAVVDGNRDRLRQLLLNLTDNAVKYNHAEGTVKIALRQSGKLAEIEISNTGPGIPEGLEHRVFDRFVRGNSAVEGCGLGLAIAKWIVDAHAGSVELTSDAAKVTTARVRFPLSESEPAKMNEN